MFVFNTLAPIGALILLGFLLRRFRFAEESLYPQVNRLVYWIFLPSLLFQKTAQAPIELRSAAVVMLLLIGGMAFSIAAGYLCASALKLPPPQKAAFVQGAYRGNLAFIGLPLILFASAAAHGAPAEQTQTLAILGLAPMVPLYNLFAVPILLAGGGQAGDGRGRDWARLGLKIISNPLILACVAGITFSFAAIEIPSVVLRPLTLLGEAALPLALISMGATLRVQGVTRMVGPALLGAAIKTVGGPLFVLLMSAIFSIPQREFSIALLYLAAPTAVTSYIMAQQLGADEHLAGSIIAVSTLMALPALIVLLAFVHGI